MNKYCSRLFLFCVIVVFALAVFFRFYKLSTVPPSLNWDEVAFGYNAYSVLKTGKDEFGVRLPLYFRSLDDYKLPVYGYMTVGSIAVFGYNDFSVRFPSAFAGVVTVIIAGIIAYLLTRNRWIGLLTSAMMSVLPWNIQFSRMAAEANAGLLFLSLGAAAFLIGIGRHKWFLFVSVVAFMLSMYSYLSFRIVAPLLGITLVALYWREVAHLSKKYIAGLLIMIVLFSAFFILDTYSHAVHIRIKGTNVLMSEDSHQTFLQKEQEMYVDAAMKINIPRRIFHDTKLFTILDIYLRGYASHFAPTFFFFDYGAKQHHTPFVGLLYIWMAFFIVAGGFIVVTAYRRRVWLLLFLWILISPIPASVTIDVPHAIRAYAITIPITIFCAIGIWGLYRKFHAVYSQVAYAGIIIFLLFFSSYYYFHQYMIHLPQERSKDWVYGRKELAQYLDAHKQNYDRIIVSSALQWPYIFLLYYSRYNPEDYLRQGGTKSGGWAEEGNKYDMYEFHKFRAEDVRSNRTLFVGKPEEFDPKVIPNHTIRYLDGTPAMYLVEGNIKI